VGPDQRLEKYFPSEGLLSEGLRNWQILRQVEHWPKSKWNRDLKKGHSYLVGRIKGKIYDIDELKVLGVRVKKGVAIFRARYRRRFDPEGDDGDSGHAWAFFSLRGNPKIKRLVIRFDEWQMSNFGKPPARFKRPQLKTVNVKNIKWK
jgi:hypothetical protein